MASAAKRSGSEARRFRNIARELRVRRNPRDVRRSRAPILSAPIATWCRNHADVTARRRPGDPRRRKTARPPPLFRVALRFHRMLGFEQRDALVEAAQVAPQLG